MRIVFFFFFLFNFLCSDVQILDVAIAEDVTSLEVSAQHGFQLYTGEVAKENLIFRRWNSLPISLETQKRGFGTKDFKNLSVVWVVPFKSGFVYLNKRGYRGKLKIFENPFGKMTVVNFVDVEDYLYGVIKSEMLINSPLEALKAQAVVARTYAILNRDKFRKTHDFGLTSDVRSQVYNGLLDEHEIARKVVDQTRGKILVYNGEPISTYYHSSCGGFTLDSKNWLGKEQPWLKSKKCEWCIKDPSFHWQYSVPVETLLTRLRESGHKVQAITDFRFERDDSGRVVVVEMIHPDGVFRMAASKFRDFVSPTDLRSTFFEAKFSSVESKKNPTIEEILSGFGSKKPHQETLFFVGKGFGHGVGLCQWGAKGLALQGWDYERILKYYYSDVEIKQIY